MPAVLKIIDKEVGKSPASSFQLSLASERITVRELIRRRVNDEIGLLKEQAASNHAAHEKARSFLIRFDPGSVEETLNAPRRRSKPKAFDEADEVCAACDAFEHRRFIILFDDRQIEDLDEELTLMPASEVVFLRLAPLVGG